MTPHSARYRRARRTIVTPLTALVTAIILLCGTGVAYAAPVATETTGAMLQPAIGVQPAAAAATEPGTFVSLEPTRVLDTRPGGTGVSGPINGGETASLEIAGRGGVPVTGAAAVVLNFTVTESSAAGFLTVYPSGSPTPTASNLNFTAGQNIPNLVTVKVGGYGRINFTNYSTGTIHLIADVAGYYLEGTPTVPGAFVSLNPARLLDTRAGNGAAQAPVPAAGTISLQVTSRGGVPASGVSAVVMNVTVTESAAAGFITVFPSGTAQPVASNLNFSAGQNIPNLVTVKLGAGGRVDLANNSAGPAHLIADVAGYYLAGTPTAPGAFVSLDPARLLDTRVANGSPQGPIPDYYAIPLQVTGRGGVPASGVAAVVANVTMTEPSSAGFVTVWPTGADMPTASNLNFTAGQNIPNLVTVKLGVNGSIALANYSDGYVQLVTDVAGYFLAAPDAPNEVFPTGWVFDDCGTEGDALLLLASPGLTFSPQGTLVAFAGETYHEYLPGASGQVTVTATAQPGFVMFQTDSTVWFPDGAGSVTGTTSFSTDCFAPQARTGKVAPQAVRPAQDAPSRVIEDAVPTGAVTAGIPRL